MREVDADGGLSREGDHLEQQWKRDPRWTGIVRPYRGDDCLRLRGSVQIEHTLSHLGATRLWELLHANGPVIALGALTGHQAVQQVRAGLQAVYCSGWQVAADGNSAGETYPDQSLYPVDSVPRLVKRINHALKRADEIACAKGRNEVHWFAPIVADGEAGFGGVLNAFELTKGLIEAGAAGVHLEDQLSSEKKCGHLGGKVVVPTGHFVEKLIAARLAADIEGVPLLLIARTDANGAKILSSDADERDREFLTGERTEKGFFWMRGGLHAAIARGLAYAPHADLVWCETSTPNLEEARDFAEAIHAEFPGKLLAYNCSPSFNWKKNLSDVEIRTFQTELGAMGYQFQFVTLAGFHSLNHSMFELARAYRSEGMSGYVRLQEAEFAARGAGYEAVAHQEFVGTGWFDEVAQVISGENVSTLAMKESTEKEQF